MNRNRDMGEEAVPIVNNSNIVVSENPFHMPKNCMFSATYNFELRLH
jgi:hypothetical protein